MSSGSGTTASVAAVTAAGAGLIAGWVAAGSTGLLAEPLRIAATWAALAVAAGAAWPSRRYVAVLAACFAVFVGLRLAGPVPPAHDVLLTAAVLAILAAGNVGLTRRVLLISSGAVLVLALYRLACMSIPVVWLMSDAAGAALGRIAAALTGRPLAIGATFAGVDFLVLTAAFYAGWLNSTERPRWRRGIATGLALLAGHLLYLVVLSRALILKEMLPIPAPQEFPQPYIPLDWHWGPAAAQLLPWNLPLVAAVIHVGIIGFMLRWAPWRQELTEQPGQAPAVGAKGDPSGWRWVRDVAIVGLAVLAPACATWSPAPVNLAGKTVVANQYGHLDWDRPQFDQYGRQSAGTFGMLPSLVESLGGRFRRSEGLTPEDLVGADVLLLLRPADPIPAAQQEAIADFVRRGGSLLVVGEPMSRDGDASSSSNDVLEARGIRVRQDVAISRTIHWRYALDSMAHPATWGIDARRGRCFSDSGASLRIGWLSRPLVVGRWGWSDPGSDAILTERYEWEAGERLGDLILSAERRFGRGTIVALGDGSSFTNEGAVWAYGWTGRLLSYLAHRPSSPQDGWRQAVSLLAGLGLLVLLFRGLAAFRLAGAAVVAAAALAACTAASREETRVVPDGRLIQGAQDGVPNRLAYIDASHLEAYSEGPWGFNAVNGLALTLMRHGYLTLAMPQLSDERLERAAMVVSIAPARRFSAAQRGRLTQFVEGGGVLILTTGAEEASASRALLADFGLRVPESPVPTSGDWREPAPMGRFRSVYLSATDEQGGEYEVRAPFFAGWPVEANASDAQTLVAGPSGEPVVVCVERGRGKVVLIGDTGFAMNKNLEYIGGEPFDGRYESAQFWRWLIHRITNRAEWTPPRPPEEEAGAAAPGEAPS